VSAGSTNNTTASGISANLHEIALYDAATSSGCTQWIF